MNPRLMSWRMSWRMPASLRPLRSGVNDGMMTFAAPCKVAQAQSRASCFAYVTINHPFAYLRACPVSPDTLRSSQATSPVPNVGRWCRLNGRT